MAVRFILGSAGAGKTRYCLETLRALERAGRPGIFLVPEQWTYGADRELLEDSDLPGLRHVRVLSFRRLAWWLRDLSGHAMPALISEAARPMLLRAVLSRLPERSLGPLAPLKDRQGFLEELGRFVGEVRNHGAAEFVLRVQQEFGPTGGGVQASTATQPGVGRKLRALSAAFEAYDSALRDLGRSDPEEILAGVPPLIAAAGDQLRETKILVDGFLSWTRREREILVALAAQGVPLEITFNCDPVGQGCGPVEPGEPPRTHFLPVRRSLEILTRVLERAKVAMVPSLHIAREDGEAAAAAADHATDPATDLATDLVRLERGLYNPRPAEHSPASSAGVDGRPTGRVSLQSASHPRQEVLLWARAIDRWIRSEGDPTRPGEITVILRSLEPYRDLIRRIFPLYGIPFFLDERKSLLAHPRARLLLGACEVLLSSWRRDPVIDFLRNPLLGVAPASVDLLENLSLQYGRDFEEWYGSPWAEYVLPERSRPHHGRPDENGEPESSIDEEEEEAAEFDPCGHEEPDGVDPSDLPEGDAAGQRPRTTNDRYVALVDPIRRRLLLPLRSMQLAWHAPSTEQGPGLPGPAAVELLRTLESEITSPEDGRIPVDPIWDGQVEQAIDQLLDELAGLWGDVPVSLEEFARTFRQGLGGLRIGVTPLRLDQVVIAEVQRSRLSGIRRAVVGGLVDGAFPRTIGEDSILNEQDRAALASLDLPLGPTAAQRQEEEIYLFYVALTRASDELLLTWSRMDAEGRSQSPSLLLEEVKRALPGLDQAAPAMDPENLPVQEIQTAGELGARMVAEVASWLEAPPGEEPDPDPVLTGLYNLAHPGPSAEQPNERIKEAVAEPHEEPAKDASARQLSLFSGETGSAPPSDLKPSSLVTLRTVRDQFDRSRAALLYHTDAYIEDSLLQWVFPPGDIASSVSRLREFADCPFLSFARRRLKLVPRPRAEVSPLETGNLAHAALERFFEHPAGPDFGAIDTRLGEIFRDLRDRPEFEAFQVDLASRYRWSSTLRSLSRFLRLEMQRLGHSPFRIKEREKVFGPHLGSAVTIPLPDGANLLLLGRIDRLDLREGPDGKHGLVLDYKSRPPASVPLNVERGLDLQLAAYLLFVQDVLGWMPAGGLYVPVLPSPVQEEKLKAESRNPLNLKVSGIFLREEREAIDSGTEMLVGVRQNVTQAVAGPEEMRKLLDRTRGWLRSYAATMRGGWIEAAPLEADRGRLACNHCDFSAVCRFQLGHDALRREPGERMVDPPPPLDPVSAADLPADRATDALPSDPEGPR